MSELQFSRNVTSECRHRSTSRDTDSLVQAVLLTDTCLGPEVHPCAGLCVGHCSAEGSLLEGNGEFTALH